MKPNFSLKYNGETITSAGEVTSLASGVTVTQTVKEYKEFDAVEWVLYFKNSTQENSGIISDISWCAQR